MHDAGKICGCAAISIRRRIRPSCKQTATATRPGRVRLVIRLSTALKDITLHKGRYLGSVTRAEHKQSNYLIKRFLTFFLLTPVIFFYALEPHMFTWIAQIAQHGDMTKYWYIAYFGLVPLHVCCMIMCKRCEKMLKNSK